MIRLGLIIGPLAIATTMMTTVDRKLRRMAREKTNV